MASSLAAARVTAPDKDLVTPRPSMAKADLTPQPQTEALSSVVTDSARRVYGKQGAAAAQLGKDEGNFSRDVKAGRITLNDLSRLGPQFLAELGKELVDSYGALRTPAHRMRQMARQQRELAEQLDALADDIAS